MKTQTAVGITILVALIIHIIILLMVDRVIESVYLTAYEDAANRPLILSSDHDSLKHYKDRWLRELIDEDEKLNEPIHPSR